jgi:1,4-dihydroxy-2-naphthoate octaprenyltransferase
MENGTMNNLRKYLQIALVFAVLVLAVQLATQTFPGWTLSVIIAILLTKNISRWMDGTL